jgi:hypothetical protein
MNEHDFISEGFSETTDNLEAAIKLVCKPFSQLWENTHESRKGVLRHMAEMLGLRQNKIGISHYGRFLQSAY